jgi:asparagine synthase (glutamine-hydrolysing)
MRRYQQVLSIAPGNTIDSLFQDGVLPQNAGDRILQCWADLNPLMEHTDELSGFQMVEISSTLPDELLMYADKLSMAHSLEVRVPYLDRELVEYVQRLDARFKVRNGSQKWAHRRVCADVLPPAVLRRPKRGFAVNVVDGWIRDARSQKSVAAMFAEDSSLRHIIRTDTVGQLLKSHISGESDNHKLLFSLAVCEQWLRTV